MSFNDENGFAIFLATAGPGTLTSSRPLPTGGSTAPLASAVPPEVRAASSEEGGRPWRVRPIDTERSELVDAEGTPLRVVGEREPLEYIAAIVNESER